jgi:hypothetical protein
LHTGAVHKMAAHPPLPPRQLHSSLRLHTSIEIAGGGARGGGGERAAVAPATCLAKMLPTPPQCPALSLHPPLLHCVCLGGGPGEGLRGGGGRWSTRACPPPLSEGTGGCCTRRGPARPLSRRGREAAVLEEGLPTPPHLLYSTTPPSAVPVCRVGVGGAARRGWEAGGVQVMSRFCWLPGPGERGGQKGVFCHSWRFSRYIRQIAYDRACFWVVIVVIVGVFLETFGDLPMTENSRKNLS